MICGLLVLPAQGADYLSPRTAGIGGAGHAAPILNDAIYMNPSFGSFNPGYTVSVGYVNYDGRNLNVAVQDGRNEMLQAGVGYTQREEGKMVHVGASRSFLKRTGFGLGAKFFFGSDDMPTGQDFNLSMSGIVSEWVQIALIADNLRETDAGKQRNLYRQFTLGTKVNIDKIVLLYADPHLIPNRTDGDAFGHSAGIEFVMLRDFFWRLGSFRNANVPWLNRHGTGWSTGLGWVGPRFSVDWALTRVTRPVLESAHTFGLTMYF
jgi:hypothetical protein